MNIIFLSGGSGKRLWPLSNEVRSKQFLKIFKKQDGSHESMVQRMYRMIREVDSNVAITVATSENQVTLIRSQLGENVGISIEPCRRDTFPAIALATAYLHDIQGVDVDDVVVVCPVDPYVNLDYFQMLAKLSLQAAKGEANLVLMGVKPTNPSTKYGYIIPNNNEDLSFVSTFREKPDSKTAEKHIACGALWNAGVFAYKLSYVLGIAKKIFGTSNYYEIYNKYSELPNISFDYAVVEKERYIQVMRFSGQWKDLGTWETLTEAMNDKVSGNAEVVDCTNTHIINELHVPLIALGVSNIVIVLTPDGVLVSDKKASDRLKDHVSNQCPMYGKQVWGEYQVLDYRIQPNGQYFLTKHLIITPGQHISYQRHGHRVEMWTIVDGRGEMVLDDEVTEINRGDTIYIRQGMKHAIKANTELHIIEIQIGDELIDEDIEQLDWDWSTF